MPKSEQIMHFPIPLYFDTHILLFKVNAASIPKFRSKKKKHQAVLQSISSSTSKVKRFPSSNSRFEMTQKEFRKVNEAFFKRNFLGI